jgi:putative ribosome biogenesis GTPase RsgA
MSEEKKDKPVQGKKPVVVDFVEAKRKKEYDQAIKVILERASKLDW